MRVPGYESPICQDCQQEEETVQHFLYKCPMWESFRDILGPYREKSLEDTLNTREGSKRAVEFLWATKRLDQFRSISLDCLQEKVRVRS